MELLFVYWLMYALFVWIIVSSVFIVALILKDNSIMDIAYGPTFSLSGVALFLWFGVSSTLALAVLAVVVLWSLRLSIRIGRKNIGKPEDQRYATWRTAWSVQGRWYFIVRSYLQIYLLQGFIISVVGLPLVLAALSADSLSLTVLIAGLTLSLGGLLYESIADWQLDRFIARKRAGTESANVMTTGLFRYSRRPNYFGESMVWSGLAVSVLATPLGFIALLSPVLITYIVTCVTGPMLEAIFLDKFPEDYRLYMAQTSYFIPLPSKDTVSV